jgi:hypothetical protein
MRRVFPFYTFMRKNLPLQARTAITQPAWTSTPFKLNQSDPNQFVPEHLRAGFAAPLGPERNGNRTFLSSLGLPQEEAFREFKMFGRMPDLSGTAMAFGGNLNPLPKGILEQVFKKQFYSGRDLNDLYPTKAGSALAHLFNDDNPNWYTQALANTPFTRFVSSYDRLTDQRKPAWARALNLASGARVTDVDMGHQRYIQQRENLERMLRVQPNIDWYNAPFVAAGKQGNLTPEETQQMRAFYQLQQAGRDYMARRRQEAAARIGVRVQ